MVSKINLNPVIPPLKKPLDKKNVDVRYVLISPYVSAHIYWNKKISELVYEIEEPLLDDFDKEILEKLENAMLELINVNLAVDKTIEATTSYIDRTAKLLIDELNLKVSSESYDKIFYYLFRDFIGLNEAEPLLRDYFIEDIECNGIDTPVFIIHRVYRNLRTNIVYRDMDKLASFVEKLAQRTGRYVSYAQPLLDGTLPDGSIDYDEPTIYKENGTVKVSKIGEIVDKFYNEEDVNKPIKVDNIEVPSFNSDLKFSWKKADYVYRHKINEEIYELKTEFRKKIKLTGNHSIFKLTNRGLISENADKLSPGDYVAFPLVLPENDIIKEINLAEGLSNTEHSSKLIIDNVPPETHSKRKEEILTFLSNNYKNPIPTYHEHKRKRILPLKLYYLLSKEELENSTIRPTSSVGIKPILKVDKNLMNFLGLYIAEGWLSHIGNQRIIEFCFNKKETYLIEQIRIAAKECFNVDIYVEKEVNNAVKVRINSYALWAALIDVLKLSRGAKNKRVPEIVFNVCKELQQDFLKSWVDGDYGSTASRDLMIDVSYLSLFNRNTVAFQERERTLKINSRTFNSREHYTNFFTREVNNPYHEMIPMEIFNPLRNTHMRLMNKRIGKNRLKKILNEERYKRMINLETSLPAQFLIEWEKRGFIKDKKLTEKGKEVIKEIETINTIINSDLGFAKILSIKKVKPTKAYVYDFSVKDCENFIGGVGGLCCHNSRVNGTFTKDVSSRGPTYTIRKFTKVPWTPTQLIAMRTLSPEMLAYFWILLENKSSILVTGGTASGKTTLLNALAFFIPPEARVVSIEDTREINLPRENWLPSVARTSIGVGKIGEIDLFEILKSSFRQNPDYLIVGEVRGKEAFVLFQGMASGHSSLSTMHADSVDTLVRRLQTPPISLSPTLINTLDCVIIMTHAVVKGQGTRRLREVAEIINISNEGDALINTPFRWSPAQDVFYSKNQFKVFEKISTKTGVSVEKLNKELHIRSILLFELYKRKIFGFYEIGMIINEFYKNPLDVLKKFGVKAG